MSSSESARCSIVMYDGDSVRVHTPTCPKDISLNTLSSCVAQVFGKSKILLKDPSSQNQIKTDEELHKHLANNRVRFLAEEAPSLFGPITQSIFAERKIVVNESATKLHDLIPPVVEADSSAKHLTFRYRLMLEEAELPLHTVETVANEHGHSYKSLLEEMKETRSKWRKQKLGKEIQESRPFYGQPLFSSPNPIVFPAKRISPQQNISHQTCGHCQQTIAGVHYQCLHCVHILCAACESLSNVVVLHPPEHVFAKISRSSHLPLPKPEAKKVSMPMERIFDQFPFSAPSQRDSLDDRIEHLEGEVAKLLEQLAALEMCNW